MRSSIGAILMVTVPDTIIRSEWRGEAHGTRPSRSTSKRDAKVAIISMAQHARPNVTGQTDDFRAQLKNASAAVFAFGAYFFLIDNIINKLITRVYDIFTK